MIADGDLDRPSAAVSQAEAKFTAEMRSYRTSGKPAVATLHTDDRVLARITDGIYRQPSSALRELISNAYDADATNVTIDTDAPRFNVIEVRDNGRGMNEEALSRLIHHIGGSSKRTTLGSIVGTTDPGNPSLSPGGRRLIGKIGIGLFSVKQLTSHFQIITKVKGSDHRLFADVILQTYAEDSDELSSDGQYETGRVQVISVPADDIDAHGTQIILRQVNPRARDILRSKDRWQRIVEQDALPDDEKDPTVIKPVFHSGHLAKDPDDNDNEFLYNVEPSLPWSRIDPPLEKFKRLRQAVADQTGTSSDRPDLATTLDNYLTTIWTLSLSAPVMYVEQHPFDLTSASDAVPYRLTNARGQAQPIRLEPDQTIRSALNLKATADTSAGGFEVIVDGVELRRPITFEWWPSTRQAIGYPLMFVGSYAPNLSNVSAAIRGGDLEFEAYLFWNSKVVPKENNGVLVRINGASGALFDDTFMRYQVSEQTRLRQITAEIFVTKGLDAALNIDRESFNFAHPHYVILSNWLHRALRQLANTHKAISASIRETENSSRQAERLSRLDEYADEVWLETRRESSELPPRVEVVSTSEAAIQERKAGRIAFDKSRLPAADPPGGRRSSEIGEQRQAQVRALATVLDGFGILDSMDYDNQHRLLNAVLSIFSGDETL
ncbi:histidine kinase/DNA gyrase B/HSP90-like ATPase [Sphingomonas sp. PP-F2F-G114-C0414]|uniref:ATP-binding protein n=1 Tax=Sphingomonas sp. PP-F2F-G114-C0414 TaxID=2135662 RepID=UPI000EF964D1|nr:ATP-binding protein [Sphingomonas sp. PP-F2F-G114-C0414]RMB37239.1 histidine kinase/DNA gyrase B/HSP90-like ATPase [Sphingomonas sp. PP-F2F-G114-C0414]